MNRISARTYVAGNLLIMFFKVKKIDSYTGFIEEPERTNTIKSRIPGSSIWINHNRTVAAGKFSNPKVFFV